MWLYKQKFGFGGLGGGWVPIFTPSFDIRVAQKLRRIILLHGELITFDFHFSKIRKVVIFMFSDLVHVFMGPKTNYS